MQGGFSCWQAALVPLSMDQERRAAMELGGGLPALSAMLM